ILLSRLVANVVTNALGRDGRGVYFIVVIVLQVVFGFFASMIVMWFSRRREFRADHDSGVLTSNANMISALQALQRQQVPDDLPEQVAAFGIRPSKASGLAKFFASHPPIEDRIAALRS
ncbi:MAG: M48 family metalloprotease, partial [Ilumatobacter sp.]